MDGLQRDELVSFRESIRLNIWRMLEEKGIARFPRPVYGRIPNFEGAEEAAARLLRELKIGRFENVFVNPDSPQAPLRRLLLEKNIKVFVSTPRIRQGFLLLDPFKIPSTEVWKASTISGMFKYGIAIHPRNMPQIDLFIAGSVAVDLRGGRLGKGEGYSEIEYGILTHYNLVDDRTPVVTTVHDMQIVPFEIPLMPWDVPVDYISTPTRFIEVREKRIKPRGVECSIIPRSKILDIQLLREICLDKRT
ncbi:5-formyltetrahydrofolate cyclo-ligase [Thermogladius sp. 4427co]|uniref:5-formyltetrahydrofolate cyclo-ligase n=1 Tax=Thermogladius sp. 4427co TaxID=3450718 RepID=UPI003F7A4773